MEVWAIVSEHPAYEISTLGRVRNKTGCVLSPTTLKSGYKVVGLSGRKHSLHRVVAEAFVPNPNNYPVVHHADHNPGNCRADNLVWMTQAENCRLKPKRMQTGQGRKIEQLSGDGAVIRSWPSAAAAGAALGIVPQNIGYSCRGQTATAGGYIWRYKTDALADEEWRDSGIVVGKEKTPLMVSPTGLVKTRCGRVFRGTLCKNGYYMTHQQLVHRLVATQYVPNGGEGTQVNHIDGDKGNNAATNLEWVTPRENIAHARQAGLIKPKRAGRAVKRTHPDGTTSQFQSLKAAAESVGGASTNIARACSGEGRSAYGFTWAYEEALPPEALTDEDLAELLDGIL